MLHIKSFTFNPYQENTYLLFDEKGHCAIIDPGMYGNKEEEIFRRFIDDHNLIPQLLLNTHCHVDHVLGNNFIYEHYGLLAKFHEGEIPVLMEVQNYAPQMGFRYDPAPIGEEFLTENDILQIGEDKLTIIYAPGHSPAHLCFYSTAQDFIIGGDVLFKNSIGRTDLPGGNHQQLLDNIKQKLYILKDDTVVYPGHGPATTIGEEKRTNPFVRA